MNWVVKIYIGTYFNIIFILNLPLKFSKTEIEIDKNEAYKNLLFLNWKIIQELGLSHL